MSRNSILTGPVKNIDITFEDLYDEISRDWPRKAEALRARRWRAIKREAKGGHR